MVSDFIEEVCMAQRCRLVGGRGGELEGLKLGSFSVLVLESDFRSLGMDQGSRNP